MLNFKQIAEYFSKELVRTNPKGVLVEYLQHELLDSIFKLNGTENLSFIGGTAIRFFFESKRFSEDLDFDNFGLNFEEFKTILSRACVEMQLKGFRLEYEFKGEKPHFHCYIKFPGLLHQLNISAHREEKILVSVDAEIKSKIKNPEVRLLNKFGVYRNIPINPPGVLLAQKLLAILQRKREKGRDFYDASFLWGIAEPDYDYIKKRIFLDADKFQRKLLDKCKKLNYKVLAKDVEAFLFDDDQKQRVLKFQEFITEKLKP